MRQLQQRVHAEQMITVEDLIPLLNAIADDECRLACSIISATGRPPRQVLDLCWKDVHFGNGTLQFQSALGRRYETVFVDPDIIENLRLHQRLSTKRPFNVTKTALDFAVQEAGVAWVRSADDLTDVC